MILNDFMEQPIPTLVQYRFFAYEVYNLHYARFATSNYSLNFENKNSAPHLPLPVLSNPVQLL